MQGFESRRQPPSGRYGAQNYEMSNLLPGDMELHDNNGASGEIRSMDDFYAEFRRVEADIQRFDGNVQEIAALQDRIVNSIGQDQLQQQRLDNLIADTKSLATKLRNSIKNLQSTGSDSRQGGIRREQAKVLKKRFDGSLSNYQETERKYRASQRQQMERQIRIVKPSATDEEIRNAIDNSEGGPIFQQALLSSDRFGRARDVYQDVQSRHQEILRITQTMAELQQLMSDMAQHVQEQGETIDNIEKTAAEVKVDVEKGLEQTSKARTWAQKAREKRVMCFWIVVIILVIIAAVIGIYFGTHKSNN